MYNLIELAVWGRKSRVYKQVAGKRKQSRQYLVLNERAWDRLAGKLFSELPRDEAITVLNAIKQYAK
jgi:hypothetical protein